MSLTTAQLAHVLGALALVLIVAHVGGQIFAVLRQPPVIGEILGGLIIGPTLLGAFAPDVVEALFGSDVVRHTLGALYNLGLLALMFLVGTEIALVRTPANERRTVTWVTASGLLLPLAAGLAATLMLNTDSLSGAHGTPTTVALVFALAIAVTSVPVISRILVDLGIINSPLARRIITVAVLEDVCLYGVLAVVLALAEARSGQSYGVWAALGVTSTGMSIACYVGTSIVVFATLLRWGPRAIHALGQSRLNPLRRHSPLAFRLALWLALPLGCVMVGINPIFGGLLAGICVARADALSGAEEDRRASKSLARFSLAFFVPVYFAIVGLSLDLPNQFDLAFFVPFLAFGCVVKATSVWLGARLAGESQRSATSLAVALNARGGPGIVLASVTLNAGIINARFFTSLVMLSIVTSQVAGAWLGWSLRSSKGREAVGAELSPAAAGLRS